MINITLFSIIFATIFVSCQNPVGKYDGSGRVAITFVNDLEQRSSGGSVYDITITGPGIAKPVEVSIPAGESRDITVPAGRGRELTIGQRIGDLTLRQSSRVIDVSGGETKKVDFGRLSNWDIRAYSLSLIKDTAVGDIDVLLDSGYSKPDSSMLWIDSDKDSVSLRAVAKNHYEFSEWLVEPQLEGDALEGESIALAMGVDRIVRAIFDLRNYTVTFDNRGATTSSAPSELSVRALSKIDSLPSDPQKDGYIFRGWYLDTVAGAPSFKSENSIENSLTVYAHWDVDPTYGLNYISKFRFLDMDGVDFEESVKIDTSKKTIDVTLPHGTNVTSLTPEITYHGASIYPQIEARDFSETVHYTVTAKSGEKAKYRVVVDFEEPLQYRLTMLQATGGDIHVSTDSGYSKPDSSPFWVYKDEDSVTLKAVAQNHYEFLEWRIEPAPEGSHLDGESITLAMGVDRFVEAIFRLRTYAITFDSRGATTSSDPSELLVRALSKIESLPSDPQKDGYIFRGWYLDTVAGAPSFKSENSIENSLTVYAHWDVDSTYGLNYISKFRFLDMDGVDFEESVKIDTSKKTIDVTLPHGTNVTSLTPEITYHGASIYPQIEARDFSETVHYKVTAKSGEKAEYRVNVEVEKSDAKRIKQFLFSNLDAEVEIDQDKKTVAVEVPYGTDLGSLAPEITFEGASISPRNREVQDFTNPVEYRLTADNGSTIVYLVTVRARKSDEKWIGSFRFKNLEVAGTIDSLRRIAITVPYGTDLKDLTPIIDYIGKSISPQSGAKNDFSSPVDYRVTAHDGSTVVYTVIVSVAKNNAKEITSFYIESPLRVGQIKGSNISVTVPFGTDLTALKPGVVHTGHRVDPSHGVPQDFSKPVTYTVTAADGTTQSYSVEVKVEEGSSDATLRSLFVSPGTISPSFNKDVLSYRVNVGNEVENITVTGVATHGGATVSGGGSPQNIRVGETAIPITVTSENGTTKSTYTVRVVRPPKFVEFRSLTADGRSLLETTNRLTITFNDRITGLTRENFDIEGAEIEAISGNGPEYHLSLSSLSIANGDQLHVKLLDVEGYVITPSERSVSVNVRTPFNVNYSDNGRTGGTPPVDNNNPYLYGDKVTVIGGGSMVRTGHSFAGWKTAPHGTEANRPAGSTFSMPSENITLFAHWKPDTYTVNYHANGHHTGGSISSQTKTFGVDLTLQMNSFERHSFEFTGWNTSPDGTGQKFSSGGIYSGDSALNLYAQWQPKSFALVRVDAAGKSFLRGQEGVYIATPVHKVTFTYDFKIAPFPLFQKEYEEIMGRNPSNRKGVYNPVENVTWFDAALYCNALSRRENRDTVYIYQGAPVLGDHGEVIDLPNLSINWDARGYRLATEAEWEFAVRAGTSTLNYWGDRNIDDYAWHRGLGAFSRPVGLKKPNSFGLYDMIGSVDEWTNDWQTGYSSGELIDPRGPNNTYSRMARGGSYLNEREDLSSARRSVYEPYRRQPNMGFRVVRLAD